MKKYFLTGLALILPLALTAIILIFVVDVLTEPFVGLVKALFTHFKDVLGPLYRHPKLLLFVGRLTVLVLMALTILILGFIGRRFFFAYIHNMVSAIFSRIPFVRRIYRLTKEVTKSVLATDKKPFSNPVITSFPNRKSMAMGFQTGVAPTACGSGLKSVFIPTAPHPISGFIVLTKDEDITPLDVSAEDVLKFLVSCGTIHPGEKRDTSVADSGEK